MSNFQHEIGEISDIRRREMPPSKVFENIYKNSVINYEMDLRDDYQQSAILYIGGSSSISSSAFLDLVEWRRQQGYIVNIVSTDETGESTTSIKN